MKISMREVMEARNSMTSSKNRLQAEINRAQSDWKSVQQSNALSGKVKTAINGEIANYQIPMLINYYDILHAVVKEIDKAIRDFKFIVKENSETAVIDTEALSIAKDKFSNPLSDFVKLENKINKIYGTVEHIVSVSVPSNRLSEKMESAKKVLTDTITAMENFNRQKIGTNIRDKLAQQKSKITSIGGLSYSNPKSLEIFTDQAFKNEVNKAHKVVKKEEKIAFKKEHPLLAAINGDLTEADLQELDQWINRSLAGELKNGKQWLGSGKDLYIASRIKRMSDGTLVINKAGKWASKFDKLAGIDGYVKEGKKFVRLSTSGGLKQFTDVGDSLLDKLKLVDKNVALKGTKLAFKETVKGITKGTLKSAGNALKKSASFGINGVIKDAKSLVNAKGAGKIIPGLNIALGAANVVQGISKSEQLAREDGLKGQEITASKVGGALVDVGKAATVTATVGLFVASLPATASVAAVVGTGIGVGMVSEFIFNKTGIVNKVKKGVNTMIKGISGWFK
ncbi:hypothetical protein QRK71_000535 [Enterococcus faecium]|uniref:T7SS effector LXG polymorphic toxin n=1 Tax=Enterococcus TaxID=1350 RepID=UPI00115A7C22|nr:MULTISPECIES: T7SS effector LXG polymorphic toxin [Enterococcus]MBR3380371.1 hypothetical protein [Bacillus sp. (in: firmicutes)]EGP4764927.1 hypothetical protein [Enterococcus faecium]EME3563171.1 hypothetical protein [Enterococcus faecium]EME7135287.1 hypothetical protein [Enterococcus faecium]EMF0400850.1 hypothetical protein [Enterococcus faecium]